MCVDVELIRLIKGMFETLLSTSALTTLTTICPATALNTENVGHPSPEKMLKQGITSVLPPIAINATKSLNTEMYLHVTT